MRAVVQHGQLVACNFPVDNDILTFTVNLLNRVRRDNVGRILVAHRSVFPFGQHFPTVNPKKFMLFKLFIGEQAFPCTRDL